MENDGGADGEDWKMGKAWINGFNQWVATIYIGFIWNLQILQSELIWEKNLYRIYNQIQWVQSVSALESINALVDEDSGIQLTKNVTVGENL